MPGGQILQTNGTAAISLHTEVETAAENTVRFSVEGLQQTYKWNVKDGHVNLRGRRVSLLFALKQVLSGEQITPWQKRTIALKVREITDDSAQETTVIELGPEQVNWAELSSRDRRLKQRAKVLTRMHLKPFGPERRQLFDQAYESLQHNPE